MLAIKLGPTSVDILLTRCLLYTYCGVCRTDDISIQLVAQRLLPANSC